MGREPCKLFIRCPARNRPIRGMQPRQKRKRHNVNFWRYITEQQIEEAIERGELDVSGAAGKPLDLTENPYIPESQRLAFKLMKDNALVPDWIADNKEIRESVDS